MFAYLKGSKGHGQIDQRCEKIQTVIPLTIRSSVVTEYRAIGERIRTCLCKRDGIKIYRVSQLK